MCRYFTLTHMGCLQQVCKVYNIFVFSLNNYVVFVAIVSCTGFSNHCRMWNSNLQESRVINKAIKDM